MSRHSQYKCPFSVCDAWRVVLRFYGLVTIPVSKLEALTCNPFIGSRLLWSKKNDCNTLSQPSDTSGLIAISGCCVFFSGLSHCSGSGVGPDSRIYETLRGTVPSLPAMFASLTVPRQGRIGGFGVRFLVGGCPQIEVAILNMPKTNSGYMDWLVPVKL